MILYLTILVIGIACKKPDQYIETTIAYKEQHRPQFHFSPEAHWMNDPNGMVYDEGEYHLFYQYYPDSTVWGPMHWGHAVSKDLIHWQHLPIALYPDSLGMIFSGSAVIDVKNTSGLGVNGKPPLVAVFTYHNMEGEHAGRTDYQSEGMAYSNDKGRTWTKYAGNPVLKNQGNKDFRDPKVSWYEAGQKWIMTLAVHDHVSFYSSPDLKQWTFESDFGAKDGSHDGVWECPDLFPIVVNGTNETKWILLLSINPGGPNGGSATQYFVGNFNGQTFTNDNPQSTLWLDGGRDNYAGVTWSDIPKEDGRCIFLGWMSNWLYGMKVPTEKWRSAMTIPRILTLHKTIVGYRIFSNPAEELTQLRGHEFSMDSQTVTLNHEIIVGPEKLPAQLEAIFDFDLIDSTADFGIEISNTLGERYRIGYNTATKIYYSDRTKAGESRFSDSFAGKKVETPRVSVGNKLSFHVFFDAASAELFADDGAVTITEIFFPTEDFNRMSIYSSLGSVKLDHGKVYALQSIW
jgi:fructan beta-fructosidase